MSGDLVVGFTGGERRIRGDGGPVLLGRDPLCAVVVDDPRVSREHLELTRRDGVWRVRSLGRGGTFAAHGPVAELAVTGPCTLRLGDPSGGPVVTLTPAGPAEASAVQHPALDGDPLRTFRAEALTRIGRAGDNTIVLDDLLVSRHHAELRRGPDGLRLVDLGTPNGTFHNGQRVRAAVLRPGDRVAIGRHELRFDGERLLEFVDDGRVSLHADRLSVTRGGRRLLDEVSFALDECSLLAVVGPSGAGKSTLLGALTGTRPAGAGTVWYEGRDLYAAYDELRQRIGLVPQDDILHSQLTVRRALQYAAALRFGPDVTAAERDARIDAVLELIVVVWSTALACTVLGLLVSAFVTTGEQTMPILVGSVMAQLVLCGGLFGVVGRAGVEQLSWLFPSRWGYAAAAATVDLRHLSPDPQPDALWRHTAGAWGWAVAVLLLQTAALTAATRLALRRHEPGR